MKQSLIVTAIATLAFGAVVHAQPVKLDGFSLGLNWNFPSTSVDFNNAGLTGSKSNDTNDGGIQAAYSFSGVDNVQLAIGGTYSPGELKAGTVSLNNISYDWTGKELFSLYVEPAVAISPTTLAYGKLSFNAAQGEIKLSSGQSSKDDYTGYGFGLGLRTMLNPNVYLQAEVMQVNYNEKSTLGLSAKPSTTAGSVGLGYLF